MSDVLFGQSYYLRFDPKLWASMQPYAPLGTLYAAAWLRSQGYDVALFDAMLAASEAEWAAALERERPRFAVLFEDNFNYLSKMCLLRMRQAAFTMAEAAGARGCTVVVCGADATDHPEQYLAHGADFVILGEGEVTLLELLDVLSGRGDTPREAIAGLAFRRDAGGPSLSQHNRLRADGGNSASAPGLTRTAPRPVLRDLDLLPFPAWDLIDVERYREAWRRRHGYFSMNMVTTRGCPYHCNWCAKPIWGQRYNVRSPENVVAEIELLKRSYGPDHVWFADDIMGLKPGWWPRFAELIEARDAGVPFKCLSRADLLLREGEVQAIRRAGAEVVWVGAESGSQKILDAMEKGTRVEQIREATRQLQRAGVRVGFFLQFGYPGETRADIDATFRLLREGAPDEIGVSVSYPLPGTKFYERVKHDLGEQQNWLDSDDLAMLYRGPYTTDFYRQLHVLVHTQFKAQRHWRELRRLLREPGRIRVRHLRRVGGLALAGARLPLERYRLRRLERRSHNGIGALPVELTPEAAATPGS